MDMDGDSDNPMQPNELIENAQAFDDNLELQGDALHDGTTTTGFSSHRRIGAAAAHSASPRASLRSASASTSSSPSPSFLSRRRGRSDPPQAATRQRQTQLSSAGSASPVDSPTPPLSALSLTTPVRSTRSNSTAATNSIDPRGDQELLTLLDIGGNGGDVAELQTLDLSLAPKKTKKSLKSLRSLAEFTGLTQLNAANNAIGALDGLECFPELTTLCLSRNHIKRMDSSSSLFLLVNLRALDLSGNFISHIPRGIAALEVLEELHLAGNNLSALKEIDVLAKLVNLHTCSFTANPFCKLPTYKDYVVSKIVTLERLDDYVISDHVRDKSRRRFSDDLFSKDKCLRAAESVHASEQSKLREMQQALEAENVRLKDELQLKSKLLQNKSKAWSSATEQLLQLQHELAMMNLDRRPHCGQLGVADNGGGNGNHTQENGSDALSNQPPEDEAVAAVRHQSDPQRHQDRRGDFESGAPREHRPSSPVKTPSSSSRNLRLQALENTNRTVEDHSATRHSNGSTSPRRALVDSACSPFVTDKSITAAHIHSRQQIASMMSPHDEMSRRHQEIELNEHDTDTDLNSQRPSLRFPTFEDESACPAYEDAPSFPTNLRIDTSGVYNRPPVAGSPPANARHHQDADMSSPLLSPQSRTQRKWEQRSSQLAQEIAAKPGQQLAASPRRSQVMGLVEKENLVRQIQALQSCKQSLLNEIANEEQLLHELKCESSSFANHVERLESDMEMLIGSAGGHGGRSGAASRQREEETMRAKLEMLRNKLHCVEDKEHEIEATIVRMTKRVLEEDIRYSKDYGRSIGGIAHAGSGPFDKEIFALTHKLQTVIVQKEEIHSEMSRLMQQLRGTESHGSYQESTGLSAEALLLIDQHDQIQRVSVENQAFFLEKQKKVEEFKRRLRDVHDRIKIKEDHIAALVGELKDIESELVFINDLTPSSPAVHRRALSLDSQSGPLGDLAEAASAALTDTGALGVSSSSSSRRHSATGTKSPTKRHVARPLTDGSQESISSMVEAAAADVNGHFEQKFKELFSPEVLEAIKQDIYNKLSRQLPMPSSRSQLTSAGKDTEELHAAIATALETHMKLAMQSYEKQRDEEAAKEKAGAPLSPPASPKKATSSSSTTTTAAADGNHGSSHTLQDAAIERQDERLCWDQVDDFVPVDAKYVSTFRYVKESSCGVASPSKTTTTSKNSRSAEAEQRIHKLCERLEQAETECKIDAVSLMELDASGKKKSSLKVLIMGARDLPTAHLRTKNLDPYVALEIVYPEYVLPKAKTSQTLYTGASSLSLGRQAFINEPMHLPNQSFRSRTVKKSLYPVWDEEFEFAPVHSLKGFLHVRVLNDRKLSREQLVGEVKIPLRMLVHQKKIVESFQLRTTSSSSGGGGGGERRTSKGGPLPSAGASGTLRVQVQLSFSRIDKYKRALDEMVAKFVHDHHQLPTGIERIEDYEARLAAPTATGQDHHQHAEPEDGGGSSGGSSEEEDDERRVPSTDTTTTSTLPTFEQWKAQTSTESASSSDREPLTAETTSPSKMSGAAVVATPGLSSERRASLWSTPTTAPTKSEVSKQATARPPPAMDETRKPQPVAARSAKPQSSSSSSSSRQINASTSAKAAMAQLRDMVRANQSTPATTTNGHAATTGFSMLHNATATASGGSGGSRRKTMSVSHAHAPSMARMPGMSPDCFDEYSPYHPDFQLLDPLGVESHGGSRGNHHDKLSSSKVRSTSYHYSTTASQSTRTDLRIFKSPGFSRRESSGGFPERYIGLDNQTSERIKRIFGRIDSQHTNS